MNQGILSQLPQPPAMPYGLLGRPTPVPMPAVDYALDVDAADYIRRVEAADGQALELPIRLALDAFIRGSKADGALNAIKACCILAGARTLSGALVPLVGTAPTNFNFVAADYNRKTGLKGDGSTKYLDSSYNQTSHPQNSRHLSAYVGESQDSAISANVLLFAQDAGNATRTGLYFASAGPGTVGYSSSVGSGVADVLSNLANATGFYGHTRSSGPFYSSRVLGVSNTINTASRLAASSNYGVFGRLPSAGSLIGYAGRISFYSIGEALDLALLDARVTQLMAALAVAL